MIVVHTPTQALRHHQSAVFTLIMDSYKTTEEFLINKTEILSDDALVWAEIFIDWLHGVELFHWSWLVWLNISRLKVLWNIWLKLVCLNISQLKVLWDIWFKLIWLNISQFKVLWDIWFKLVWLNISHLKLLWDIWFKLTWLNISRLKVLWDIRFSLYD